MQILENNLVAVESLLKHHSDVINVNALGEEGLAPIHQSIILGYKQLLKILITKGNADVNIKDLKGWTPLHYSSNNGDIKCSKYLISKGANSFVYSDDHQLPIDVAKNVAMISFLSREIAKSGHVELEYFYLSKHGLLNNDDSSTKDLQVYNEVFLPSFAGDSDNNICRDSSSSSSNLSPNTLFLLYIEQNQYNFLDALLKRETVTILNSLDLNGLGAMHWAAINGYHETLHVLAKNDASVDINDENSWTPLHAAVITNQIECVKVLLDHKADIFACNNLGDTVFDLTTNSNVLNLLNYIRMMYYPEKMAK